MSTNPPLSPGAGLFAGLKVSNSQEQQPHELQTPVVSNRGGGYPSPIKDAAAAAAELPAPPQLLPAAPATAAAAATSTAAATAATSATSTTATSTTTNTSSSSDDVLLGKLKQKEEEEELETPPASNGGLFGWLGGGGATTAAAAGSSDPEEAAPAAASTQEENEPKEETDQVDDDDDAVIVEKQADDDGVVVEASSSPTAGAVKERVALEPAQQETLNEAFDHAASPKAAAASAAAATAAAATGTTTSSSSTTTTTTTCRFSIHPDTPVRSPHTCLALLRKFAYKTRPNISVQYGGAQARSLLSYVYTTSTHKVQHESTFAAYRALLDATFAPGESREPTSADEEGLNASSSSAGTPSRAAAADGSDSLGTAPQEQPDNDDPETTRRAGAAAAAFVDLFGVWGHASSAVLERKDRKGQAFFAELLCVLFDTASNLAAHGCLDFVQLKMNNNENEEHHVAAQMLAGSVFNSDLSLEKVELSAMKFLLGAGCRQDPCSLLRGSYLLQSIRTLYHVYLTTESKSNKVTARAALQQLVTSVFGKVVLQTNTDTSGSTTSSIGTGSNSSRPAGDGVFPSENHRDAFLVLRSICKLSMRNLPSESSSSGDHGSGGGGAMHSHVGLATSASNDTWDGEKLKPASGGGSFHTTSPSSGGGEANGQHAVAQLVYTSAIHPALESKLLALELILYVLQHTDFSAGNFIQHAGPQFHAAIRNYLCVSLLKNCTSDNTRVVNLSLRIFVPVVRNFRTVLKSEIEAFVTNVFFVILDSKNSPAEHKSIVVNTFNEICSDPSTLAEIFLNYDCDLSAVDLFHRIVNTLSRLSRSGLSEPMRSTGMSSLMGGPSEAQMEKFRSESRELRLDAMRALRQILASLHSSIVEPLAAGAKTGNSALATTATGDGATVAGLQKAESVDGNGGGSSPDKTPTSPSSPGKQSLVEIYGSKKKRRAEESEAVLRFNQKPSAGIKYAAQCKHIDPDDPTDVARYLLKNKDEFEKTQIGEYLGREAEYQGGFCFRVLHEYARLMDFQGLVFDEAIRFFLSGFRLPGEAQKIDRIMEKFAERFTEQNPTVFPTADAAFILSFSIIMLNTDLHNPAIKEERRMTKDGFIRNNRGICDGQDLPAELLNSIFDRIKKNPISLKEDEEARERVGDTKRATGVAGLPAALSPSAFFSSHYKDEDRARETNFQKERDHIVRTTESLLKRRRHSTMDGNKSPANKTRAGKPSRQGSTRFVLSGDSGLRDEYVSPMFDVTWGPALAAFSTAIESANGTVGALISIASDEELELAAENAAETIEVCLTGFRFAIGTAGLCGNSIARDAYMIALSRFSQLGTGVLLEPRHVRCVQTMLSLAREDGELLGGSWEHVFRALSEINRFHQLFHLMARNDRVAALASERRRERLRAKELRRDAREQRRMAADDGESINDAAYYSQSESDDDDSLAESGLFTDEEEFELEENMDAKAIDESNAREIYDAVSEGVIEAIYERSSSLSANAVMEFVVQLCFVSRAEISVGTNDQTDLTQVTYRQKHALLNNSSNAHAPGDQFHHTQPNIYNLQKLVEVTHYNMASRPRLLFSQLWVTVADHLTDTALHSNPAIAMYAVDSFRQLSIQYLQRDELEVFEFQRRFLKPLETVMACSHQTSTKELLLNCIGRLMHVFDTNSELDSGSVRKGGLRSGWVPILIILGLGGRDKDKGIAQMSFKTLSGEIQLCIDDDKHPDVLLSEHFVETVDALLSIVGGPHDDISLLAIGQLTVLTDALANGSVAPVQARRKGASGQEAQVEDCSKQKLGLWWPILLGLSRAVGDPRLDVRTRSLEALFSIINEHFLPADSTPTTWETLQLIFRGVLNSILEFAESSSEYEPTPGLPEDFEQILGVPKEEKTESHDEGYSWLETTFDAFLDACVAICLSSMANSKDSILVEEVFAIINSCLLSDSGALAVRGLRRLEQFVTSDLDTSALTDDVWATVSHMLQRCLTVRGLPKKATKTEMEGLSEDQIKEKEADYAQDVNEFIAEDNFLSNRRYIGSNATMVIGLLLSSDRFSIGLRWRLFLVKWLHRGIREWDIAAEIVSPKTAKRQVSSKAPDYRENALYGRKWTNRLVLQLASMTEIIQASPAADPKTNRFAQGQKQVIELTEAMLLNFVQKEEAASKSRHSKVDETLHKRYIALVHELLSGYGNMGSDQLKQMPWISPVLLNSCIRSKNEDVRLMVQKLVGRTSPGNDEPYPSPDPPESNGVDVKSPNGNGVESESAPVEQSNGEHANGT